MDDNKDKKQEAQDDLKQQAIKFKALRYTFSQKDITPDLKEKTVQHKLKASQHLETSYRNYIKSIEKDGDRPAAFPWDSRSRRLLYWLQTTAPRFFCWCASIMLLLFVINYCPGPTQHIVEFMLARAVYDTGGIPRLPNNLETYAHSAKIVGADGGIIKSYGKRRVTRKIPEKVKIALLACEDHYLLPNPNNPWYVNSFLIHAGVSWWNLAGAVKDTLLGHTRGASTIIMQNAKKILGNDKRTIAHKLEEIIYSYMLVSKFGKEKNLDFYINTVPVGSNMYGFPAAAENYFKKKLNQLSIQQLVTIGAFIPNHNRELAFYEIWRGKSFDELSPAMRAQAKAAIDKINKALLYLKKIKVIDAQQYASWRLSDENSIRKIGFCDFHSPLYGKEEWTSWNVIREVTSRKYKVNDREISGERLLLDVKGDVVIKTGVDVALVAKIKNIISTFLQDKKFRWILRQRNKKTWKKDMQLYEERKITPPYSTFDEFMAYLYQHINVGVIIINRKGRILAYVGGKQFLQPSSTAHIASGDSRETPEDNRAVIIDLMNKRAKIAPSSTIKPIIAYYTMLVDNSNLQETFVDKPIEYKYVESEGKNIWLPRNWYPYNKYHYLGRSYSLLEAQVLSVNTIFARLWTRPEVRSAVLAGFDKIGLEYNHEDAKYWPFGIGASSVPVQQWLALYNAFLDGYYRSPSFVKKILINGKVIYDAKEREKDATPIFDSQKEREEEMQTLFAVCNRGTGETMKDKFKYYRDLVAGKTGTGVDGRSSLFVSDFNPYENRSKYPDKTITMMVIFTTNTGGFKSVGTSTEGPTQVAGEIYNYLFQKELQKMMDREIEKAKLKDGHFRNNHVYWANVNRYMERLLNGSCGNKKIYQYIRGVDGYQEAMEQILNPNLQIYAGRDDLFKQLVDYYCDPAKLIKMRTTVN